MDTINNNIIEDDMEIMHELNVNARYPASEDYTYICQIERINLDKEKVKDLNTNNGFIIRKKQKSHLFNIPIIIWKKNPCFFNLRELFH